MPLSDVFIQTALEKIDSPNVVAVGIVGSYARGQETKYSDVDFDIYVTEVPEDEYDRYTMRYWDDKLISLKYMTIADERSALSDPQRAIWAVPGLRGMKILLDKDGSLAELLNAVNHFDFSLLQAQADRYAADRVMHCAEEVHKILHGLARGHESTVLHAVWGLVKYMPHAVMVQRGLMMTSENRAFDIIQEAVGRDTKWVSAFRGAWGLDAGSAQYQARGAAALRLYRLTAAMFDGLIPEVHRPVVENTLRLIKEVGY